MDYGRVITRSLHLTWRYKWLWLLAFFAGETSGSPTYNGQGVNQALNGANQTGATPVSPNFPPAQAWIQDHLAVLALVALIVLVLYVVLFLVSCAAEAAVVRGADAADREEPIGLGRAISLGMERFASVVWLRLLLFLAGLVLGVVVVAMVLLIVLSFAIHAFLAAGVLIVAGVCFAGLLFLVGLVFPIFTRLSLRAVILDRAGAIDGIAAAVALIRRRAGPVIVLWAIELAIGLAIGIAVVLVLVAVGAPAFLVGYTAFANHSAGALVVLILLGVLFFGALIVFGAAAAAYLSVYWTLGYRQLQRT